MITPKYVATLDGAVRKYRDNGDQSPGSVSRRSEAAASIIETLVHQWDVVKEHLERRSMFEDIAAFHEKFKLEYEGPPRGLDLDLEKFRVEFMAEELCEYVGTDDFATEQVKNFLADPRYEARRVKVELADKLDALVDLCYVALGTAYFHGFDFDEAWRRVQEANMRKVRARRDGADSKRGSGYDVVKPPGWEPPDLSDLVEDR